jgi:dUTP pyrophosphatase
MFSMMVRMVKITSPSPPQERALIPTGLIFDIPEGYSIRIHPRSGMALKYGLILANCRGCD